MTPAATVAQQLAHGQVHRCPLGRAGEPCAVTGGRCLDSSLSSPRSLYIPASAVHLTLKNGTNKNGKKERLRLPKEYTHFPWHLWNVTSASVCSSAARPSACWLGRYLDQRGHQDAPGASGRLAHSCASRAHLGWCFPALASSCPVTQGWGVSGSVLPQCPSLHSGPAAAGAPQSSAPPPPRAGLALSSPAQPSPADGVASTMVISDVRLN